MHEILLFANETIHRGLAWHSVKKYSPYYKDIAHQKGHAED